MGARSVGHATTLSGPVGFEIRSRGKFLSLYSGRRTYLSIEVVRKYLKLLETTGKHAHNMPILLTTQAAAAEGGCRPFRAKHADGIDETGGSRLRRLPPVWSIESACFARVFLWFQAVLSIYVSPLWISKSSSMVINISGVLLPLRPTFQKRWL